MRRDDDFDLAALVELSGRSRGQHRRLAKGAKPSRRWQPPDFCAGSEVYLLQCRLRAALRHLAGPGHPPRIIGIQLSPGDHARPTRTAIELLTRAELIDCGTVDAPKPPKPSSRPGLPLLVDDDDLSECQRSLKGVASAKLALLLIGPGVDVSARIAAHVDVTVTLAPPTARHIAALVHRVTRQAASDALIAAIAAVPARELDLVVRRGRSIQDIVRHLNRLAAVPTGTQDSDIATGAVASGTARHGAFHQTARLDDLAGMDEAVAWGRELARDLADWKSGAIAWSDIDPGVLLAGPPGTGKTLFARALATSCGVHLETASRSSWQSAGYLNLMLKAMRASFSNAAKHAPSILFIDEIDAFGDRAAFEGHNETYDREVVVALLECLDGIERREGVVVVAATNDPGRLDAALLRSGRLDRVIHIPAPGIEARARIMRMHLELDAQGHRLEDAEIRNIVAPLDGFTGADLERLVRLARRRARAARRAITAADLLAVRPEIALATPDEIRRVAVHEAGHALLLHLQGIRVLSMEINAHVTPNGFWRAGTTTQETVIANLETESSLRAQLAVALAGHAAEEVILGERSNGAGGGGEVSDLAKATDLALKMEAQLGLGCSLAQIVGEAVFQRTTALRNPYLLSRVEARLAEVYAEVAGMIEQHRALVEGLAERLMEGGSLDEAAILARLTAA